jgi:hypothetical protein
MIIGSHDSTAYKFDYSISFWKGFHRWNVVKKLANLLPCVKKYVTNVGKCQTFTIYQQLSMGIRALDIRLTYSQGVFYCSHTFATVNFFDVLEEIRTFPIREGDFIHVLITNDFENRHSVSSGSETVMVKMLPATPHLKYYYNAINIDQPENVLRFPRMLWYNTCDPKILKEKYESEVLKEDDILCAVLTPNGSGKFGLPSGLPVEYAKILDVDVLIQDKQPFIVLYDFVTPANIRRKKIINRK